MKPPRTVTLDRLEADGTCLGHDAEGNEYRVRGGVPGTTVLAAGKRKNASMVQVTRANNTHVAPACAQFGTCGGCLLQPMPLSDQRDAKRQAIERLLSGLNAPCTGISGDAGYGYRNKLELSFGTTRYLSRDELAQAGDADIPDRKGRFLGMHGPGRFDRIVDTPRCEIAHEAINRVLDRIRTDCLASPYPLWEPHAQTGFWRHVVLRRGADGRVLALLYTSRPTANEAEWLAFHAQNWTADAVVWYTSDRTSDAAVGTVQAILHGTPALSARLGDVEMSLSPTAFFQVNDAGAQMLLAHVQNMLGEGGTLLDLYCGVGAFGLALRERFTRVGGIELHNDAVHAARENARRLGVRAVYRSGAVEYELPALLADFTLLHKTISDPTPRRPERLAVLVDPPRSGLHPKALTALGSLHADVLVYIACKPASLARDAVVLMAAGWRCTEWTIVDLFPQTPHVEVVARFVRQEGPALG